jgi:hypothetical protein
MPVWEKGHGPNIDVPGWPGWHLGEPAHVQRHVGPQGGPGLLAGLFDPSNTYLDWVAGKTQDDLKAHAANAVVRLTRNNSITTTHREADMARSTKSQSTTTNTTKEDTVAKSAEQEKGTTEEKANGTAPATEEKKVEVVIPDNAVKVGDAHYVPVEELSGKKGNQVAKLVAELKKVSGTPVEFNELCKRADAKYPQDVQAAMFGLQLAGLVTHYVELGKEGQQRAKAFYAWTAEDRPSS